MSINKKILRFQISINNILFMKILQRENEIRSVEPRDVGGESSSSTKVGEEFAAVDVFH